MGARKNLAAYRQDIVARLERGESLETVARVLGCHREAVRRQALAAGVVSVHPRHGPARIWVDHEGERITLHALSQRLGIPYKVLWNRYQAGDRGERLKRPHKRHASPRDCYECGVSLEQWRMYAEAAADVGPLNVANRTGLPYGAITAAMRGE